jgi:hypothetical protein
MDSDLPQVLVPTTELQRHRGCGEKLDLFEDGGYRIRGGAGLVEVIEFSGNASIFLAFPR